MNSHLNATDTPPFLLFPVKDLKCRISSRSTDTPKLSIDSPTQLVLHFFGLFLYEPFGFALEISQLHPSPRAHFDRESILPVFAAPNAVALDLH